MASKSVSKFEDFFRLALTNFSHRKKRTLLTVIGIFIGIAAVVALVALGQGLQDTIDHEFQKIGYDKFEVMSLLGDIPSPFASQSATNPITEREEAIVSRTSGVLEAASMIIVQDRISFNGKTVSLPIGGIPVGKGQKLFEETFSLEAEKGRLLRESDGFSVVLGKQVAENAFSRKVEVGERIIIAEKEFKVVGIAKSFGDPARDSRSFISKPIAREVFNKPKIVSIIFAKVEQGKNSEEVSKEVARKLRQDRGQKEGEEDFAVVTFQQFQASISSIFSVLNAVLVGIAAISLLVGGVGIMNTMYTSVVERTQEIGIMKAIGARNSDIAAIFLVESGLLGLLGGLVGVIFGVLLAFLAEFAAEQALGSGIFKASISADLLLGALLFSFVIGSLSGVLPALRASALKPVDAIRK